MTHDLRLAPAAVLAWAAAAVSVGGPAERAAQGAAVCILVAAGLLVRGIRRAARGPSGPRGTAVATACVAVVAAAAVLTSAAAQLHVRDSGDLPALTADRAVVTVTGVVRSEPRPVTPVRPGETRVAVVVALGEVTGRGRTTSAGAAVLVLGDEQWSQVAYGATVRTVGRLGPTEPGEEEVAVLVAGPPREVEPPGPVDRTVGRFRQALLDVTSDLPPDLRGLVPGAAVGDTSRVPADLEQAMRDTGLTHITAVSGGHFAVLSVSVLGVAALLGAPRRLRASAVVAVMTAFVLLVHPGASVVRAAAMGAVGATGLLAGRPAQAVPALGGAVVVLCVLDPWLSRSYGFVLSVAATAAIVLGAPPLSRLLGRRVPRRVAVVVAVPVAAQAVCAPVLVLLDPVVATYAVPANVLAAPAVLPATLSGVLGTLVAPWSAAVAHVLLLPAAAASWWIATVARALAGLPGARLPWPAGPTGAWALLAVTVLVVVGVVRWSRAARPVRMALAGAACAALALRLLLPPTASALLTGWPPDGWQAVACDVGQGDALVVRSGPQSAVLVDVGPADGGVGSCLDALGVRRIDLLVLTHAHADHVGGLAEAVDGREVVGVVVSPLEPEGPRAAAVRGLLARTGAPVTPVTAPATGTAGEVHWEVLAPADGPGSSPHEDDLDGTTINDSSVVLHLAVGDLSLVALGDAEPVAQEAVLARLQAAGTLAEVDVVKVAHHGSARQSAALAAWLSPAVAVISAGRDNTYGHPDPRAVALYEGVGALVVSTDRCGRVALQASPREVEVWARCPPTTRDG